VNSNEYGIVSNGSAIENKDFLTSLKAKPKVVKMKKHSIKASLSRALQSTQFDGLNVLTKDAILQVLAERRKPRDEDVTAAAAVNDDETVTKFMTDVGQWLQDQNKRFKVTIKKKYINDILMMSKGAQQVA